ncbi:type II toxin-antitoxin system VapB family antitoxin (plasmid) [Nostoc sp. UHCC 0926]|uniref:type II toxin-antitoxin system VapB family antitoxin n=2 Tax=Nostoc TaxID=1177 RepID=UPI001E55845E|nr:MULTISPECIES: type II toxin-antitoxin system VapB family antitoxin [unclassified Nostoc]MCC5624192.1 type II toxin-antitoxin system VapB family antitoxin [Nostoc sp. CHAB 5715]WDD36443.1 type II toxin-antitoxin system VapB family antitoxin [Nostoc sp. UHCC 0926]
MTINLQIDEALVQQALAVSHQQTEQTERDVVEQALREYVQRRQQMKVLDLFGKIDYDENYNYKQQRHQQ